MQALANEVIKKCDDFSEKLDAKNKAKGEARRHAEEEQKKAFRSLNNSVDVLNKEFKAFLSKAPLTDMPAQDLVEVGKALGNYLSYQIKINKIRRFLDALRRIEVGKQYDPGELALMRPQLAYAVGRTDRDEKECMKRFMDFFDPVLKQAADSGRRDVFEKALKLMETIIAFHRYYGGSD